MTIIRRAHPAEADALTALMHASSAYTGTYASILDGYAVSAEQVARDHIYLADIAAGRLGGFYSLTLLDEPELDLMFVADEAQGTGLGRALFDHMREVAAGLGLGGVKIVSHPPSVGFYLRMGAIQTGIAAPTRKARWERPILSLPIGVAA